MGVRSTGSHPSTTKADGHLLEYFRQNFSAGGGGTNTSDPPVNGITATGGVINDYSADGYIWRAHTFTASGAFNVTDLGDGGPLAQVDYLLVGGGGGGGFGHHGDGGAGGGGGGALRYAEDYPVSVNPYPVVVGAGGGNDFKIFIGLAEQEHTYVQRYIPKPFECITPHVSYTSRSRHVKSRPNVVLLTKVHNAVFVFIRRNVTPVSCTNVYSAALTRGLSAESRMPEDACVRAYRESACGRAKKVTANSGACSGNSISRTTPLDNLSHPLASVSKAKPTNNKRRGIKTRCAMRQKE